MLIIGISGKKATGKDLLGKYLIENHGFQKASFAAYLKERVRQDFGLTEEQTDGKLKETATTFGLWTPRSILQAYGSFFRAIDVNFWVRKAIENLPKEGRFVFTDVRYPNEAEAIKVAGGVMVRLERDLFAREEVYPGCAKDTHESETGLDAYDGWNFILREEDNVTPSDLERFGNRIMDILAHDEAHHDQ